MEAIQEPAQERNAKKEVQAVILSPYVSPLLRDMIQGSVREIVSPLLTRFDCNEDKMDYLRARVISIEYVI